MSSTNSSASNSSLFSQTSLKFIETYYDEELEQYELEEEKEIFAQMFQTHYNTTSLFIQTVQETHISKQTKKLRILKRKLRKLMRKQISRGRVTKDQGQEGSISMMTQLNQSKNYPDNEGQYYGIIGNNHQETDNQKNTTILEPIINPDISSISSASTLHSTSQINMRIVNNVDVKIITNNKINIINNNNNNEINTTNNQCEGIIQKTFQQYDPNEQYERFQHQQQ